jgi:hypothetical protein
VVLRVPVLDRPASRIDAPWLDKVPSLAEIAQEARGKITGNNLKDGEGPDADDDTLAIYVHMHEKYFDRPPNFRKKGAQADVMKALYRVQQHCEKIEASLPVWVSAQMAAAKQYLPGLSRKLGFAMQFKPSMLVGKSATRNYNAYVHASKSAVRNADASTFDWMHSVGQIYAEVVRVESMAAESALHSRWDDARKLFIPLAQSFHSTIWEESRAKPPNTLAGRAFEAGRMNAACLTASLVSPRLPFHLGVTKSFNWDLFLDFLADYVTDHKSPGGVLQPEVSSRYNIKTTSPERLRINDKI